MIPRLSLAVPIFEPDAALWTRCVDSILQLELTCEPEIVISVDPSSRENGGFEKDLERLQSSCKNLIVTHNPERLGMVGNWNNAVEHTGGDVVLLIGQDDLVDPAGVDRSLTFLDAHPEVSILGHRRRVARSEGATQRQPRFRKLVDREAVLPDSHIRASPGLVSYLLARNGNVFGEPCSLLFRRQVFDLVGGFDGGYSHMADLAFIVSATREAGGISLAPYPIATRSLHGASLTRANSRSGKVALERNRLFREAQADMGGLVLSRARGAHAVFLAYDGMVALRASRWRDAALDFCRAMAIGGRAPLGVAQRVAELLSGKNSDRWMVRQFGEDA